MNRALLNQMRSTQVIKGIICGGLLALFCSPLFGQLVKFYAEPGRILFHKERNPGTYAHIMEMKWRIKGQEMQFGTDTIRFVPDPHSLDTLFYQNYEGADWDTILFNAKLPGTYVFEYNECCNGFNIRDLRKGKFAVANVMSRLSSPSNDQQYLVTLGEGGMLVGMEEVSLFPACRSAMSPNIIPVTFSRIDPCSSDSCQGISCLLKDEESEHEYDYSFELKEPLLDLLYMPIDQGPLMIIFDPETKNLDIR